MLCGCGVARSSTSEFVFELLIIEIYSREAPWSGMPMEVLFKEIGILTPFGPTGLSWELLFYVRRLVLIGTVAVSSIFHRNYPSICKHNCVERWQDLGRKRRSQMQK